jgi:hypothetical protein
VTQRGKEQLAKAEGDSREREGERIARETREREEKERRKKRRERRREERERREERRTKRETFFTSLSQTRLTNHQLHELLIEIPHDDEGHPQLGYGTCLTVVRLREREKERRKERNNEAVTRETETRRDRDRDTYRDRYRRKHVSLFFPCSGSLSIHWQERNSQWSLRDHEEHFLTAPNLTYCPQYILWKERTEPAPSALSPSSARRGKLKSSKHPLFGLPLAVKALPYEERYRHRETRDERKRKKE